MAEGQVASIIRPLEILGEKSRGCYVLAGVAADTWQYGRHDKHVDPLFEELVKLTSLPSPIVFLSLDGDHKHLHRKFNAVPSARIFATQQVTFMTEPVQDCKILKS